MSSSLSTLCHVENNGSYLMMHRTVKKNDVNKDKWIGIGGHFEADESPEECMVREAMEETGLTLENLRYRGLVTFVSGGGVTEYMSLFSADWNGDPKDALVPCDEGDLRWVHIEDIWDLNIWEGDKIFFRLLDENVPFFSLKLVYDGGDTLVYAALNGKELELFDILDENGNKTGVVRERGVAHRDGSLHGTVHTWIARKNEAGEIELLLQKRSDTKDSHPGCYDISSAGHIGHGEEPEDAAIRELREELGISLKQEDLTFLGTRRAFDETTSHGFPFRDNEINYEFVTTVPVSDTMLRPDPEEVSGVLWLPLSKCLALIKTQEIPHCLAGDELLLLQNHFSH
ncbi:MAG: NUDIX domain-containing protein [Lachnospiraceae bacterium]|nr:NUDIX domain-containing protein [Lachnospiraceae bacterium]